MRIKRTIEKVPGGLMVVPLLLGALLNTIDKLHLPPVQAALEWAGAAPLKNADGTVKVENGRAVYEFLSIGGFTSALFKTGAMTLIALFLFCAASQMNLRVGGRALKKGVLLTASKYAVGVGVGYLFHLAYGMEAGLLGLSTMTIIAAMTNSNGGMYCALTAEYGNRSDVGAIAVLSLNDGPFLTMVALGVIGERFPLIAFLAVLLPIGLGMLLGNLDADVRAFLKPGETVTIPFFALALGTTMDLSEFINPKVVAGGVALGALTTLLTGLGGMLTLRLFGERSAIAGFAEGSTAGNAVQTPAAILLAAAGTANEGLYAGLVTTATAQISIACVTTAVLCPIAVILWDRRQRSCGIDGRAEA